MKASNVKFLERAGSKIAFVDEGAGDPPMLFIHGMACNLTDWREQLPFFRQKHRVVAIDLPGHGQSSDPKDGFKVEMFADTVAWVIDELKLKKPVVVGHSYGGLVTLALGIQYPQVAEALVALDTSFELPAELVSELDKHFTELEKSDFEQHVRHYTVGRSNDPGDDPKVVQHNVEMLLTFGREKTVAMGRSILAYGNVSNRASAITAPTLFVGSSRPFSDPQVVRTVRPDWYYGRTVGAGHWHQVLVPDQINAMIRDFLIQVERGFPAPPPYPF